MARKRHSHQALITEHTQRDVLEQLLQSLLDNTTIRPIDVDDLPARMVGSIAIISIIRRRPDQKRAESLHHSPVGRHLGVSSTEWDHGIDDRAVWSLVRLFAALWGSVLARILDVVQTHRIAPFVDRNPPRLVRVLERVVHAVRSVEKRTLCHIDFPGRIVLSDVRSCLVPEPSVGHDEDARDVARLIVQRQHGVHVCRVVHVLVRNPREEAQVGASHGEAVADTKVLGEICYYTLARRDAFDCWAVERDVICFIGESGSERDGLSGRSNLVGQPVYPRRSYEGLMDVYVSEVGQVAERWLWYLQGYDLHSVHRSHSQGSWGDNSGKRHSPSMVSKWNLNLKQIRTMILRPLQPVQV
jgi:hypothetical protein